MKQLGKVAVHERTITLRATEVDNGKVSELCKRIAAVVFDSSKLPAPVGTLEFMPGLLTDQYSVNFEYEKKHFLVGFGESPDDGFAKHMGDFVSKYLLGWAFGRRVSELASKPVNTEALRGNYEATCAEMQAYVLLVAERCSSLRRDGAAPVVLVGHSGVAVYLRLHRWGPGSWQCPPPPGVTLRSANPSNGETALMYIDDTPVYEYDTPNADCYVVPASMLKRLDVAGSDESTALSLTWTLISDDRMKFVVSWKARFA